MWDTDGQQKKAQFSLEARNDELILERVYLIWNLRTLETSTRNCCANKGIKSQELLTLNAIKLLEIWKQETYQSNFATYPFLGIP